MFSNKNEVTFSELFQKEKGNGKKEIKVKIIEKSTIKINEIKHLRIRTEQDCEFYYKKGKLHRENDLPAVENPEMASWYINGLQHRIGKPSFISKDGETWCENGKLHNTTDYAVKRKIPNSNKWIKKYFINNKELTSEEFEKRKKIQEF